MSRFRFPRGPAWMSVDGDMPDDFVPIVRWGLIGTFWIPLLIAWESGRDHDYLWVGIGVAGFVGWIVAIWLLKKSRRRTMAWILIAAGAVLLAAGIGLLAQRPALSVKEAAIAGGPPAAETVVKFVPTRLRLQFFGDDRLPVEISRDNVSSWFAYRTPVMSMQPMGADGKPVEGGFSVPPNWAIFIVLEKATTFHQVIPTFSNPDKMPFTEVRQTTQNSIVLLSHSQFSAGVLDVATAE